MIEVLQPFRRAEEVIGLESETATLLWRCPLRFDRRYVMFDGDGFSSLKRIAHENLMHLIAVEPRETISVVRR